MNQIIDESNDKRYFTVIPNLIDDIDITPFAFRLYVHLKRVAGETGECWQSTRTLAGETGISVGMISTTKRELEKAKLITIQSAIKGRPSDTIRIVDIWERNTKYRQRSSREQRSPHEHQRSPHEHQRSPHEHQRSPHEPINNQLTITHEQKLINNNTSIGNSTKTENPKNTADAGHLPKKILNQLSEINWTDSNAEIIQAYQKDSRLVISWLNIALSKVDKLDNPAGFFRKNLRTGKMPPDKMQPKTTAEIIAIQNEAMTQKYREDAEYYGYGE